MVDFSGSVKGTINESTLNALLEPLRAQLATIGTRVGATENRLDTAEPKIDLVNAQQQQNVGAITGLQTNLSKTQGDVDILKQQVAGTAVESANGAPVTPGVGTFYNSALAPWTIAGSLPAGGQVKKSGSNYGGVTTAVFGKYYKPGAAAGVPYFKDASGVWWKDNGTTLITNAAGDPDNPTVIAESTNGASTVIGGAPLYDPNLFAIRVVADYAGTAAGSKSIIYYDPAAPNTPIWPNNAAVPPTDVGNNDVQELFYWNHAAVQRNSPGKFYSTTRSVGGTFSTVLLASDPRVAPPPATGLFAGMTGRPGACLAITRNFTNAELDSFRATVLTFRSTDDGNVAGSVNVESSWSGNDQGATQIKYLISKGVTVELVCCHMDYGLIASSGYLPYKAAVKTKIGQIATWIIAQGFAPNQILTVPMNEPTDPYTTQRATFEEVRAVFHGIAPNHYIGEAIANGAAAVPAEGNWDWFGPILNNTYTAHANPLVVPVVHDYWDGTGGTFISQGISGPNASIRDGSIAIPSQLSLANIKSAVYDKLGAWSLANGNRQVVIDEAGVSKFASVANRTTVMGRKEQAMRDNRLVLTWFAIGDGNWDLATPSPNRTIIANLASQFA